MERKIIEIGCGKGEYLALMQQVGADAYGIEHSDEAVKYCIGNNLNVTKDFIDADSKKLAGYPFAGFYSLNYFEHLPDPNTVLRGISHNLSEDAFGLVEVPNLDMILRKNLFAEFIGDHLLYFTKETLSSTLAYNGYDVIDCEEIWYDYIISAVVRKKRKLDLSHFNENKEKLKKELNAYIDQFGMKNVAIWGAGHQALAVISLTEIGDKVKYVLDSAVFKQNKFTPATHLPIFPPDTLNIDPVKAVIVMAASYSDEVTRIIREKYSNSLSVAILRENKLEIIQEK